MRKHAKDSGGDGGGGVEVETMEDGADGQSNGPLILKLTHEMPSIRQADREGSKDHNQASLGDNHHIFRSAQE